MSKSKSHYHCKSLCNFFETLLKCNVWELTPLCRSIENIKRKVHAAKGARCTLTEKIHALRNNPYLKYVAKWFR